MVRRHISDDIKEMALSMSLQGISQSDIREMTGVSERSLKRLRSTYRTTGAVSAKQIAPGRPRVLTAMEVEFLCNCIERQPDMTLTELQVELREVCTAEITRPALERNEQDREEFKNLIDTHFSPEQLVFADESHFNRLTLRRPFAWSKRGERA
ncbi:hypothetical protein BJV77DRAFT_931991, partial [Russula vinacea]